MYDAVVLGLGGMGSAALAQLAKRGLRVLGIDRFERGHERGASTGRSRIIRQAYFEHPAYVPLLLRAYELWRELERDSAATLLDLCGVLMVGPAGSRIVAGARVSAARYGIDVEELSRAEVVARYPGLRLRADESGLFEPRAGMVFPEAAIDAHLRVAARCGAEMRFETAVNGWTSRPDGIALEAGDGPPIHTRRLAICAGPWLGALAGELGVPLRVQRNVQIWFAPATRAFARERFPAFFVDRADQPAALYGFPDHGDGVKAALHRFGETTEPGELDRDIRATDIASVKAALDAFMPGAAAAFGSGKVCMYTLTPDEHFLVDTHPADARVVIAGGFSGHGYKFCPVIGEIVADLTIDGGTRHAIEFLRLARLSKTA